ncbi:ATP-dependent DNA ligase [Leifsonia sp. Root227]|uniref:ATP-dependent DNA ligase n=1 Tax=Leifsonia sp. Root227 TaxID=1736496 RepID=UPI0006F4B1C6|nr:ATP-dependent DNA ligase [Leifsonia sp. Root227]KRC49774.1 ATP-dependent DNA ligase [Leifsonia sp. Root227]
MASTDTEVVELDGHRLKLTNLDKVLYPETGTTKADVIGYYNAIAEVMLPHIRDRIATRKRWVHGVGTPDEPGEVFFQKNLDASSTPSWVKRRTITHKSHSNDYPLVNDRATLIWLAQIAALEIHVPQWRVSRNGTQKNPDRLVLDLDPGDGVTLADCAEVAVLARRILIDMGLDPMPVTSGSKGIHLYAALDGSQTSDQVSAVAHELARVLEADHPDLVVSDMKKALRVGKVLVDWSQNNGAKTTIAPYSLRGRFHPMVAAPRTWRELARKDLAQLDYTEVLARVKRRGDPLSDLSAGHLDEEVHGAAEDRLTVYRSKRDAAKTPEPVPDKLEHSTSGRTFVIQEHHARRLHWDFRLEHDGVLVSWALPKGPPTDPGQNHLAVHVEDHPLEYGAFEGDIPHGEYGAGHVTIWDAGDYDLEKWRDDEVIVTLHGTKGGGLGGDRRFALIHTGGEGKAEQNWLIHLMKDDAAKGKAKAQPETQHKSQPKAGAAAKATTASTSAERVAPSTLSAKPISPMLATLGSEKDVHDEDEWAFEMKWDGIRAIAEVRGDALRLSTRNGNDVTVAYPELATLTSLADGHELVLDGEIVALDPTGRPDFGLLQTRMGLTRPGDVEAAVTRAPVHYLVFDILELDGHDQRKNTYDERRATLEDVLRPPKKDPVQVPPAFDGDLRHAVDASRDLNLEGVMAKQRDGTYATGRRSRTWIKIKHHRMEEVVIAGWTPGNGRRANGVGALLLGIPDGDGLRYVGKVGTGFTDAMLDDLATRLAAHPRKTSPLTDIPSADARDAHWVRPELVGEVEFAEWTPTKRLRQPSWRGLRLDKAVADINVE